MSGVAVAALSLAAAVSAVQQPAGTRPLAYVRSVLVKPVAADYGAKPERPLQTRWLPGGRLNQKSEAELRRQRDAIRKEAPSAVQSAVTEVVSQHGGLRAVILSSQQGTDTGLAALARENSADAAMTLRVDRCGLHAGLEREVWVRLVGEIETARSESTEKLYGVGWAKSTRKLIGGGFTRTDSELLKQAAKQALAQIARQIRTGERPPFAAGGRVLVLRAAVPAELLKIASMDRVTASAIKVEAPALLRQSDVLFQPDLPPVVETLDPDRGEHALAVNRLTQADLWDETGLPRRESVRVVAERAGADFVFLSRVREVAMEQAAIQAADGKSARPGMKLNVDVTVFGALYSLAQDRVIWQDVVEGGTVARTEYVRSKPRIRTDEQAIMDATHTAYAYLRYSFDEFHRRYSR